MNQLRLRDAGLISHARCEELGLSAEPAATLVRTNWTRDRPPEQMNQT